MLRAEGVSRPSASQGAPDASGRRGLCRVLVEVLLLLLCLLPGQFLSLRALQEPWTMFRLARAYLSLQSGHIVDTVTSGAGYRVEHIGGELIQAALLSGSSWSPDWLALLPVGSLLLAVLYYGVSQELCRSRSSAAAIALYASWFYPRLYSQFGNQTYAWTNTLFLSFLIALCYWVKKRTCYLSAVILMLYVSVFLFYHTTSIWVTVMLTVAGIGLKLRERAQAEPSNRASWALPTFCAVFYLAFDTVFYGNALRRLSTGGTGGSLLQSIWGKVVVPLVRRQPSALGPFEIAPTNSPLATHSTLLVLLLLTVPAGLWSALRLSQALRSRSLGPLLRDDRDVIVWAILVAAAAHAVFYSLYGALSLRMVPLAFPLILPLVWREFRWGLFLERASSFALAALAVVGCLAFFWTLAPGMTARETGLASQLIRADGRVLAGADVYGALLLNAAEGGKVIDLAWLDSNRYAEVVGQGVVPAGEGFDYVAVDRSGVPLVSSNWTHFQPWAQHLSQIQAHSALNTVYDSENLILLQRSEIPLPDGDLTLGPHLGRSWVSDAARLFGVLVGAFALPGWAILRLGEGGVAWGSGDTWIRAGLALGLGISCVTLLGYATNFSALGLRWLVPLCLGVAGTLYVVRTFLHRPIVLFRLRTALALSPLLCACLVWSALSSRVAWARDERREASTEFFVTASPSAGAAVRFYTASGAHQGGNFSIAIAIEGVEIQRLGPRLLSPGGLWVVEWCIPPELSGERIVVSLERDSEPHRRLVFRRAQVAH